MIEMLYKKKIIRDFLSLFTENYWKQLITCILEYGIINFKKHHNIATLTPEDIFLLVETLKKDENLLEKKRGNLYSKGKTNSNLSRNRSKSYTNYKDSTSIKSSRPVNSSITSSKKKSGNNNSLNEIVTHSKRIQASNKDKIIQTNLQNNLMKNKNFEKNCSSKSLKREDKSDSKSKSRQFLQNELIRAKETDNSNKIKVSQNLTKTNYKNSNSIDSESERNFCRNNIPPIKNKLNVSGTNNKNKKKKTEEIIEQINLKKLKEKKENLINRNSNNNLIQKRNNHDNKHYEEDNSNNERSPSSKKVPNHLSKVESKIKSALIKDKKIYNLMKNSNNTYSIDDKINIMGNSNMDSKNKMSNFPNNNLPEPKNFNTNIEVNYKSGILSLEERLNRLTRKLNKTEQHSLMNINDTKSFGNKAGDDVMESEIPLLNSSLKANKNLTSHNPDNNITNNNIISNLKQNKFYYKEKDSNLSSNDNNDEDYITEDQFNINKSNYLYNNDKNISKENDDITTLINYKKYDYDHDQYENDELDNHNYDDLEE